MNSITFEESLKLIEETAKMGAWGYDIYKRETWWSKGTYEIYGYELDVPFKERVENQDFHFLKGTYSLIKEAFALCVEDGTPWNLTLPFQTKQKKQLWVRTIGQRIVRAEGRFVYGIIQDVTESRLREQTQLTTARMTALGEMAAGVAHEINNPLSIAIGNCDIALSEVKKDSPKRDALTHNITRIREMNVRISSIVKGMREFSRDGCGDDFEEHAVADIITTTLDYVRERFKSSDIEICVGVIPIDLKIRCQSVSLSQVLVNLFNNAFDSLQDSDEKKISLSVDETDTAVNIVVSDTGPGVAEEWQERIFTPFFTTKPVNKGTGLGLSVSKGLLEAHGGDLTLRPSESGAVFVMSLPKLAAQ